MAQPVQISDALLGGIPMPGIECAANGCRFGRRFSLQEAHAEPGSSRARGFTPEINAISTQTHAESLDAERPLWVDSGHSSRSYQASVLATRQSAKWL